MKKLIKMMPLALVIAFVSCKNEAKIEPEIITVEVQKEQVAHTSETISANFSDENIQSVFANYIALKTTLVNTNATDAAKAAVALSESLGSVEVDENIMKATREIEGSTDIEHQRAAFFILTANLESVFEKAIESGAIYKQYCPMAFNNNGASWFSESKEIRNPYFGDKMLKCGRIEATLQ